MNATVKRIRPRVSAIKAQGFSRHLRILNTVFIFGCIFVIPTKASFFSSFWTGDDESSPRSTTSQQQDGNKITINSNRSPPSNIPSGPIDDALCHVEDLEEANDSQLYSILQELKRTEFFRNFVVDLDHKCPLTSWRNTNEIETEEDEFECTGGKDEIDEDAEPLCTVQGGDPTNPFMDSNALHTLQNTGFQSRAQQDTFTWNTITDAVFTEMDDDSLSSAADVSEDNLLPDTFWKDMCSRIGLGDSVKTVNLALNPERNTGYNGTHIWKAIYEENCVADTIHDMCLEERVLYRLLSGLHTSTTLSIAMHYYPPSKKKKREHWESNPNYFMQKFQDHPDHIRNLHFSYLVLLRSLRKATPFLYNYTIDTNTDSPDDDKTTQKLLQRLLDSSILQSCNGVFYAFDESQLFREEPNVNVIALKQNFKGIFHNVSSILDCVQCQQCKLHGKLTMTGYGVALKVLFMNETPELEKNEIIALINTIVKFSESIKHVKELTKLYNEQNNNNHEMKAVTTTTTTTTTTAIPVMKQQSTPISSPTTTTSSTTGNNDDKALLSSLGLVDTAVGLVAALGREHRITIEREEELVHLALSRHPELLILAKHYALDIDKFLRMSSTIGSTITSVIEPVPDAIVVGSGLAGLACTLNLLDRGGRVILIEKEHLLGGNSNKASSGINACCPTELDNHDSLEIFMNDTIKSAGDAARPDLIQVLVSKSGDAVAWLKNRVGVDLSLTAQLGGHTSRRTHRPSNGMAGAEIIYGMQKAVKEFVKTGDVTILTDTKVNKLIKDDNGSVIGVECINLKNKNSEPFELFASNVVLATGGFAADRSYGSYLDKYRPELLKMPTTAGHFSTGDGITLARELGAATVDMDKVQVHPTGWVDPNDPENTSKVLAAELMRGVGGILLNDDGDRFCNELGTRSYVTDKMLKHDTGYAKTGNWSIDATVPTFSLILSSSAAADGKKHVDLYTHKGLLKRLDGVKELSEWMNLPTSKVIDTLKNYQNDASEGKDEFGKTSFRGVPAKDLETEVFYAGKVTPVLHYCMGGITIDTEGNVLNENGEIIPGLHAAGEVSGGVHGVNRLAGNSLLECTVYGTIVGQKLPVHMKSSSSTSHEPLVKDTVKNSSDQTRKISKAELERHNTEDDCWVAIHGIVYDLTDFADEHPAGAESIHELAGKDGTEAFAAVHNKGMLEEFDEEIVGVYSS